MKQSNNRLGLRAGIPLAAHYRSGRMWHQWVEAGTGYLIHATPHVTDDFGNSVRVNGNVIRRFQRQYHDPRPLRRT